MEGLREIAGVLKAFGYKGDCLNLGNLWYAVRVGACSWQYLELVTWLEGKIMCRTTGVEFATIFQELRSSYLKITPPLCDPIQFRFKMLEYLSHALSESSFMCPSTMPENDRSDLGVEKNFKNNLESMPCRKVGLSHAKLPGSDIDKLKTFERRINKGMVPYNDTDQTNSETAIWLSIVNDESPTGEITKANWDRLKSILRILVNGFRDSDQLNSSIGINFNTIKYNDQIRVALCSNLYSVELLHRAIRQLMEEEKMVIFNLDQLNQEFVLTAWTWIPKTYIDPSIILDLIALHNSSLCTDDWSILKEGPTAGSGRHYLLKLCRSALPVLKATEGYLSFGSARIYLRLNKELRKWFDFNSLKIGDYVRR